MCVPGRVCTLSRVCNGMRGTEKERAREREKEEEEEGRVTMLALVHLVRRSFTPVFRPFFVLLFFFPPFSIDIFIYVHIKYVYVQDEP